MQSATPWVLLAVLLFWSVGAYNRLVRLRSHAITAFQALDGCLGRYITLVNDNTAARQGLPRAQLGAARASVWAGLQGASTQFEACLRVVRKQVLDARAVAALHTAHITLQAWWTRAQDEYREHPDLLPVSCQSAWAENTRLVVDAVAAFNRAVLLHNAAIAQFPAWLLARLFSFRPAGCL